ncbi:DUF2057 family protein [Acinetobacter sp. TY2]|uniref:YccT family protein n=1 Tax=Acinetobacter sp. TY2 TaxID=3387403 RepID=UPI003917B2D9
MGFKYGIAALGLVCGSLLSGSVFAAVTISAPEEIVLLAVNDQEVNTGLFRSKKNEYKVDAGQVALSVRYQQYFEHLSGEHDILKSGIVTVTAPDLKDGQTYQLALVNAPRNFDEGKAFAIQPTVAIYDKNKKMIVQQTGVNNEAKSWLSSGIFAKVVDLTGTNKTANNQPAPIYANNTVNANVPVAVETGTPVVVGGSRSAISTADQQLIQIWQKASKVERQKFMSWLATQ